jgi:hypothetical protein
MYKTAICLCVLSLVVLGGCHRRARIQYSQAQLNAMETREVDAGMDETFSAAAGALFDAGYTISMSDRQGGLLTGTRALDRSSARMWVDPHIQDTKFAVTVQIRETSPKICTVRIKTSVNGQARLDRNAITEMWTLMQRQVMMKEPVTMPNK